MADLNDIFSHSTPQIFWDEPPANSGSIGERILDRGFDIVDSILVAKYGTRATLPLGQSNTTAARAAALQQQQQAAAGGGIGLLLILALLLILFLRR